MVERIGDLVLSQVTYVLLQDGATGQVEVVTGTHKVSLADILARNIKEQRNGSGLGELLSGKNGGWEGLMETVKGTPLEDILKGIIDDYKSLKSKRKKTE